MNRPALPRLPRLRAGADPAPRRVAPVRPAAAMPALLLALAAGPALADAGRPLVYAGAQGAPGSRYAWVGVVLPVAGGQVGDGPYLRAGADWLRYRYDATLDGVATRVQADAPGVSVGGGRVWRAGDWALDLSLSVSVRDTRLSPDDRGRATRGTKADAVPQLQLRRDGADPLWADLIAAVEMPSHDRFARARAGWTWAGGWRTGVQADTQGGDGWRQQGVAAVAGRRFAGGLTVDLSLGRSRDQDHHAGTTAGVALSTFF